MGGSAFLSSMGIQASRINRIEFDRITADVLQRFPPQRKIHVSQELRSKQDFGDIDFVVLCEPNEEFRVTLQHLFGKHILLQQSGHSLSMIYEMEQKQVQIDFSCFHDADQFVYHCHFFDWNDTCCILGEIISRCLQVPDGRLKLCDKGLVYRLRFDVDSNRSYQEIVLQSHFFDALTVTGFDVNVYQKGFDTEEDVFAFLVNNPYFDKSQYIEFPLNSHKSKRLKRRQMRTSFYDYVDALSVPSSASPPPLFPLFQLFPDLSRQVDQLKKTISDENERNQVIKSKFNGHFVKERYGVHEKDMTACMKQIVTSRKDWKDFVFRATEEDVWTYVDQVMANTEK